MITSTESESYFFDKEFMEKSLFLEVASSYEDSGPFLDYFNVTSFEKESLRIQLTFLDPYEVSINQVKTFDFSGIRKTQNHFH